MLQNKYLPTYHFTEKHSIIIQQPASSIWPFLDCLDFSDSRVIRILFAFRGMPARMMSLKGLEKANFVRLEQKENEELIIGLIGQFWRLSGNLQSFRPEEFIRFSTPGFAKATWNFRLQPGADHTVVETETRIFCTDARSQKTSSRYWFLIRPFSGLIRLAVLKKIKKKAESSEYAKSKSPWNP